MLFALGHLLDWVEDGDIIVDSAALLLCMGSGGRMGLQVSYVPGFASILGVAFLCLETLQQAMEILGAEFSIGIPLHCRW